MQIPKYIAYILESCLFYKSTQISSSYCNVMFRFRCFSLKPIKCSENHLCKNQLLELIFSFWILIHVMCSSFGKKNGKDSSNNKDDIAFLRVAIFFDHTLCAGNECDPRDG